MSSRYRRCCVPSCNFTAADNVTLHCFPNPGDVTKPEELERFRTWVMRIGGDIVGEDDIYIHRNRYVCHRHFEDVFVYSTKKLNRLAIPTLHIPGLQNFTRGQVPVIGGLNDVAIPSTSRTSEPVAHTGSACGGQRLSQGQVPVIGGLNDVAIPSTSRTSEPVAHTSSACDVPMAVDEPANVTVAPSNMRMASRQTVQRSKPMTKIERELRDTLKLTKNTLKKCRNSKNIIKTKLILANKIIKTSAFETVSKKMSPAAKTFFKMQISQFGKRPRGRRFSLDEKILALSVYKPSPKAYKLLSKICILPKRRTLDKILQKVSLFPGINDALFEHLKKRVDKMPSHHKLCSVIFDEMAIAPHVNFDKSKDLITGFVDNGFTRENTFCDHVLVFMVRGIIKKFKQPVAFTFCAGTTKTIELKKLIEVVIGKVMATGLRVISTVCDQGATNMAAVNALMNETKANCLRENKMYKGGYFELQDQKIYPIYDPPHLMKGIRNNMLTKDLEYVMEGKPKRAKWAHLEALYRRGPGYKGVRLINKVTAQHIMPNLIPKMRVKYCTQVFSQNVGIAMGYMAVNKGFVPLSRLDTTQTEQLYQRPTTPYRLRRVTSSALDRGCQSTDETVSC